MSMNTQSGGFVEIFVGLLQGVPTVNSSGVVQQQITPRRLGIGQTPPEAQTVHSYFGIKSDMSGQQLDFDNGYSGSECVSHVELTQWDEGVLRTVASIFNIATTNALAGALRWHDTDIGRLVNQEGFGIPIWYRNVRRNVPAQQAAGLAPGYRYVGSRLIQFVPRQGNRANSALCVWHHRAVRDKATGIWTLRDMDLTAVANLTE